jgi:hypothetical protein
MGSGEPTGRKEWIMPRYRVTISGQGYEAMADLVRVHEVVVLHRTSRHKGQERYTVEALADDGVIQKLTQAGYQVERHEDVDELGRQRQQEVGQGNRYATS